MLSRDQVFHRQVMSGQTLRVFTYSRFHPDSPPRIELRASPTHGTVAMHETPVMVGAIRDRQTDCTGRAYTGIGIWYTPASVFQGTDGFAWDMVGTDTNHDGVVVDVQLGAAPRGGILAGRGA